MSQIKFNHVFTFLLALSALSAFVIPPRFTNKAHPQVQSIFAPVSGPARRAGAWLHGKFNQRESPDRRNAEDVKAENQTLRGQVIRLTAQLEFERKRNAQWATLGDLRDQCVAVEVAGADAGPRESLALQGSTLEHVRDNAVALYPGGVAGQVSRAGLAGAQLRLITDKGFRVRGYFVRMNPQLQPQRLSPAVFLFEGVGGAMVMRQLNEQDAAQVGIRPGDLAVVEEREWPPQLRGVALGAVTKIEPRRNAPGFVEIRVEPPVNLELLDEVMVMKR
jgi:cell shape-determining protein MreC